MVIPVLPGREEALREYVRELEGPKADEEAAIHQRYGIRRETVWLQETPNGSLAVIYQEVEDPSKVEGFLEELRTSDEPFVAWVRENLANIYGIDPSQGTPPLPELVADRTF